MDTMDKELPNVLLISLITFMYILLFNRFISMIFVMNFSTAGLNLTALLSLLYLLPGILIGTSLYEKFRILHKYLILSISLAVLNIATLIPNAMISSIFAGLSLAVCTIFILNFSGSSTIEISTGFGLGLVIYFTTTVIFSGLTLYPTILGKIIFVLLSLSIIPVTYLHSNGKVTVNKPQFYLFLGALMYTLYQISNPFIVVTWELNSATQQLFSFILFGSYININLLSGVYAIIGILSIFVYFEFRDNLTSEIPIIGTSLIFIVSTIDLIFLHFLTPLMFGVNIISLLELLTINQKSTEPINLNLIGFLSILLLLVFLQSISGHWVFLPTILQTITKGMAGFYILFMALLFVGMRLFYLRREIE